MFTGIIQAVAKVKKVARRAGAMTLTIQKPRGWKLRPGQSVATNGVCLTVTTVGKNFYQTELMGETLACTTFGKSIPERVNLERSLTARSLLDGHLMLGHVDTVGTIIDLTRRHSDRRYRVAFPKKFKSLIVEKGSVAVDGVSLTIASSGSGWLQVALVDFTLCHTALKDRIENDSVNLEFDIIGKYVQTYAARSFTRKI